MVDRLSVLIEAPEDLNFLVYITNINTSLSSEQNTNPSPSGRQITSSTTVNDDVIRISGWLHSLKCGGEQVDVTDIILRLKRFIELQKYTVDDFATITTPHEVARFMNLKSVDIDRDGDRPQEIIVSMVWQSVNLSGEITDPNLTIGGVQ